MFSAAQAKEVLTPFFEGMPQFTSQRRALGALLEAFGMLFFFPTAESGSSSVAPGESEGETSKHVTQTI